jgi:hypothetical protein
MKRITAPLTAILLSFAPLAFGQQRSDASGAHQVRILKGVVQHRMHLKKTGWTGWGVPSNNPLATGGIPNGATDVACAALGGSLNVFAIAKGRMYHNLRDKGGGWSRWYTLKGFHNKGRWRFVGNAVDLDARVANNIVQIVVVNNVGHPFHATRSLNGAWTHFTNLDAVLGGQQRKGNWVFTGVKVSAWDEKPKDAKSLSVRFDAKVGGRAHHIVTRRKSNGAWINYKALPLPLPPVKPPPPKVKVIVTLYPKTISAGDSCTMTIQLVGTIREAQPEVGIGWETQDTSRRWEKPYGSAKFAKGKRVMKLVWKSKVVDGFTNDYKWKFVVKYGHNVGAALLHVKG